MIWQTKKISLVLVGIMILSIFNIIPAEFKMVSGVRAEAGELVYKNREVNFRVGGKGDTSTAVEGMTSLINAETGSYLECDINVPAAGEYEVAVEVKKYSTRGIFQLSIDGVNQGDPQDLYTTDVEDHFRISLGKKNFDAPGVKKFRFTVTGKNPDATDYILSLYDIFLNNGARTDGTNTSGAMADKVYKNREVNFQAGGKGSMSTAVEGMTSLTGAEVGSYIECDIDIQAPGTYRIMVDTKQYTKRGIFQLSIDGENQGEPQDLYSATNKDHTMVDLGQKTFSTAGVKKFRFTVTGKNPESEDYILSFYDITLKSPNSASTTSENGKASQFTDIQETGYEKAITMLASMGIIKGYQDNTFRPENTITRAEFAQVIIRMLGAEPALTTVSQSGFQDVGSSHWAAASISLASGIGIIGGYGNNMFGPDDSVTYEQAIKMLVCALGYGIYAEQKGGYPTGYLIIAAEKGITKNTTGATNGPVARGTIAQLAYNALDVEILDQTGFGDQVKFTATEGTTLMSKHLDTQKEKGIIRATSETTLIGETNLKEDEVQINGVTYKVGDTHAKEYLGYQVTFYAKEDQDEDEKTLVSIEDQDTKNTVITVKAENVYNVVQASQQKIDFEYWLDKEKDDKPEKATISSKADVIYNGKAYTAYSTADLQPANGAVVLIDNNNDGEVDVVLVTSYTTYIVDSVSTSTNSVGDRNHKPALQLDPKSSEYTIYMIKKGTPIELKDLKPWNILSVAESKAESGKLIRSVLVSEGKVSGEVEEVDDDEVIIAGQKYKLETGYKSDSYNHEIKLGDSGDFYLNYEGKIAAYDAKSSSGRNYAFVVDGAKESGINPKPEFKLYTLEGKMIVYKTADKVKVDGCQAKAVDLFNANKDLFPNDSAYNTVYSSSGAIKQLIAYELNSDNEITEIDTATVVAGEDENTLTTTSKAKKTYISNGKTFNGEVALESTAKVFAVPSGSNGELLEGKHDEDYSIKTAGAFSDSSSYYVQFYNVSDVNTTNLIVYYKGADSNSLTNASLILVDKVSGFINEKGENVRKIYGLQNGNQVTLPCDDSMTSNASALRHGDVIQVSSNDFKEVDYISVAYSVSTGRAYTDPIPVSGDSNIVYAKVIDRDGDNIIVGPTVDSNVTNPDKVKAFSVATAKKMMYDKQKNNKIMTASSADIQPGQSILMRINDTKILELVVTVE